MMPVAIKQNTRFIPAIIHAGWVVPLSPLFSTVDALPASNAWQGMSRKAQLSRYCNKYALKRARNSAEGRSGECLRPLSPRPRIPANIYAAPRKLKS